MERIGRVQYRSGRLPRVLNLVLIDVDLSSTRFTCLPRVEELGSCNSFTLDHSSTALLDVDVNLDRGWFLQEQVLAKIRTILTTILGHSKRLSRVFLHCVSEDARMMSAISLFCSSHASNLEKLYIGLEHLQGLSATAHVPLDPSCPTIFATGAPKLRHLHLQGLAIQKFRPPLSTLTVLELVQSVAPSITYMALRTILTTPVALAHLSLRGAIVTSENIPEFPSPDHLIPLPALETLRLCGDPSANAFTRILTHSSLPRLRTLVLVELNEVDLELDFSGTEFPSLTVLVFIDFDISKVVYSRLFAAFPKIESFICSYSTLDTSSSTKLLVEAGAGGLWPCLKSLAFAFDEEDSGVKGLVKGRQDLLCPLTTLRFITEDEEALSLWLEWLEEVDLPLKREEGTITYMGCHLKSWSYPERQWPLSSMDLD